LQKNIATAAPLALSRYAGEGSSESSEAGTRCFLSFHTTLRELRKAQAKVRRIGVKAKFWVGENGG
jgi:hypothetical protein